jgi:hypothetical protein
MLRNKNLKPGEIAAINAFAISFLVGITALWTTGQWPAALISFFILFWISFALILYFTNRFI